MESGLLLDIIIGQRSSIFKLLAGEDQALLIWGDTLLVLDLGLDIVDSVGRLHLKGDGLAGEAARGERRVSTRFEQQGDGRSRDI